LCRIGKLDAAKQQLQDLQKNYASRPNKSAAGELQAVALKIASAVILSHTDAAKAYEEARPAMEFLFTDAKREKSESKQDEKQESKATQQVQQSQSQSQSQQTDSERSLGPQVSATWWVSFAVMMCVPDILLLSLLRCSTVPTVVPPHSRVPLSILAGSLEQKEIVGDWFIELCCATGHHAEALLAIQRRSAKKDCSDYYRRMQTELSKLVSSGKL
jgi:hypothetical protein